MAVVNVDLPCAELNTVKDLLKRMNLKMHHCICLYTRSNEVAKGINIEATDNDGIESVVKVLATHSNGYEAKCSNMPSEENGVIIVFQRAFNR